MEPTLRIVFVVALVGAASLRCGSPRVTVTAGSPTPAITHSDDPFASLSDLTDVGAYELGRCNDDRDCDPGPCGGSVCAPIAETALCADGRVAACLAEVDQALCGCVEGYCRWQRQAPVMFCVAQGDPVTDNRQHSGAPAGDRYPIRVNE